MKLLPFGFGQPVASQVVADRWPPSQSSRGRTRQWTRPPPPISPSRRNAPEKAGRAGKEDAAGVAQVGGTAAPLRSYVRFEDRLGAQVAGATALRLPSRWRASILSHSPSTVGFFEEGAIETCDAEACSTRLEAAPRRASARRGRRSRPRARTSPRPGEHVLPGPREQHSFSAGRVRGELADHLIRSGGSGRRGSGSRWRSHLAGACLQWERPQPPRRRGYRVVREAVLQDAPDLRASSRLRVEAPSRVAFSALIFRAGTI